MIGFARPNITFCCYR